MVFGRSKRRSTHKSIRKSTRKLRKRSKLRKSRSRRSFGNKKTSSITEFKKRSKYGGFIINIIEEITNIFLDLNQVSAGMFLTVSSFLARYVYKEWKKGGYLNKIKKEMNRLLVLYGHEKQGTGDLTEIIIKLMAHNIVYKAMTNDFYLDDELFKPRPVHNNFDPGTDRTPQSTPNRPRHAGILPATRAREAGQDQVIDPFNYEIVIFPKVKQEARVIYGQYKKNVLEKTFDML